MNTKELTMTITKTIVQTILMILFIFSIMYTSQEISIRATECTVTQGIIQWDGINPETKEFERKIPLREIGKLEGITYEEQRLFPGYTIINDGNEIMCELIWKK